MQERGKLIAIEGIDGSGKGTQLDLLAQAFAAQRFACAQFSFPRYGSSFGKLIARFLNGEFGELASVDAHLSALLFAGDRFEARPDLEAALASGKTLLVDRYIASNLAHQTARVPESERDQFVAWLSHLEYGLYRLPAEDLVLYLRLPVMQAHRLVGMKESRSYTSLRRDLQEADIRHLQEAAKVYDSLAGQPNWVTIECMSGDGSRMRAPEEIHTDILAATVTRLPQFRHEAERKRSGVPR